MKNAKYVEPIDYIPEDIRRKNGVGEFNSDFDEPKKKTVKRTKKDSKVDKVRKAMKGEE